MTPYNFLASLWRTFVPIVLTVLGYWLAKVGIHVDSTGSAVWMGGAFSTVYYTVFRWAELHLSPRWGWLLGLASPPQYQRPGLTDVTPTSIETRR